MTSLILMNICSVTSISPPDWLMNNISLPDWLKSDRQQSCCESECCGLAEEAVCPDVTCSSHTTITCPAATGLHPEHIYESASVYRQQLQQKLDQQQQSK